jgi:type II secretory pathway pseudopilin PulG
MGHRVMRKAFRNGKGMTVVEALIALCVIGVLTGVVIAKYQRVLQEARESAVKAELANIRSSIALFKMLNGRNPESLNELIEKDVMLPARIGAGPYTGSFFKQKYLMANAVDAKGNLLDAFGNPFTYNPNGGEVKSNTKGCETW